MRTSDRVKFVAKHQRKYDWDKKKYVWEETKQDEVPCHVSDLGVDRSMQLFGNYTKERKVIRLDNPHHGKEDLILYQAELYRIVTRRLSGKVLFIEKESVAEYEV